MRALTILLILGWSLSVSAELRPSQLNHPERHGIFGGGANHFELQVVSYSGARPDDDELRDSSRYSVAPKLKIVAPIFHDELILEWGFSYYSRSAEVMEGVSQVGSIDTTLFGNPYLGYDWVWRRLGAEYRAGFGATAPLASVRNQKGPDKERVDVEGYTAWLGMTGLRDAWLVIPEHASGVLGFEMKHHLKSNVSWGLAFKGAAMFNVGDASEGDQEILAQLDGDIAWEREESRFGLRGTFVQLLQTESDDKEQASLAPEVRLRFGGFDLTLGMTLPIDEPFGPFMDSDKDTYWGFNVALSSPTKKPKTGAEDEELYEQPR